MHCMKQAGIHPLWPLPLPLQCVVVVVLRPSTGQGGRDKERNVT